MAVGVIAEDEPRRFTERKRLHPDFSGVARPLLVARIITLCTSQAGPSSGVVPGRFAFLVADDPGVLVVDRVGPRSERHAAVRR